MLLASDRSVHESTASAISHLTGIPCTKFEEDLGPILAIEDSVVAGASKQYAPIPNLESEIPDMRVDAGVSRQFSSARSILAPALAGVNPPRIVVLHLGTNGRPTSTLFANLKVTAENILRVLFLAVKLEK